LSAHEIASTLTRHHLAAVAPRTRSQARRLSQFLSHSPPSGAVRRRSPWSCSRRPRTVTTAG